MAHRQHSPIGNAGYIDYRLLPIDVATSLRAARLEQDIGLREAACKIGIDPGYLSRLERGHRAPRIGVAQQIIWSLDLDDDLADRLLAEVAPEMSEFRPSSRSLL